MIPARRTGKARTATPRAALRLKEGDTIACAIEGDPDRGAPRGRTTRWPASTKGPGRPTARPRPALDRGDVVRVPNPCTDGEARQPRPSLVVAQTGPREGSGLLLRVPMITCAEDRSRAGDVEIPDAAAAGLPAPSVLRRARTAAKRAARAAVRSGCPRRRSPRSARACERSVRGPARAFFLGLEDVTA